MNKKVIFFHPYFSDGGVERTNLGLAKGLIENGYRVVFLTTSYTNHFMNEINELGIELKSLGDIPVSKTIFHVVKYLNQLSQNEQIIFISCQYYVNVISMLISKLVRYRKNVIFINSERNHLDEFKINGGFKNFIVPFLVKLTYKYADKIIANAQETADDLSTFLGLPVECVYNPTINERLLNLQNESILEEWYLKDNRKTILGIGRLSKQKDFETLIRAFYEFGDFENYKLVILGDGKEKENLEELIRKLKIENHVYLQGFVSNPYKFLKNCELFVLSSRYEGLPNVLIEALSLNSIAISTKCKSGPKEILQEDALLVDVGDERALSKTMRAVLSDKEKAKVLTQKAFEGLSRFSYENSVKSFIKVINK